jgi:16S rRNA processing protein RimM
MTKEKQNMIKLAFVAHPHGLRGEAELRLINTNIEESILDDGMKVWLFPSSDKSKLKPDGEEWTIEKLRFGNKVICQFQGMKDRTHLETLIPFEIFLDRESFPEADEGEVYLVDLIGMKVFSPEGEELGQLESFSDNGMQYLFDVRLITGEKITLPYVDAFFPELDMENKKMTMIMPEYTE